MLLSSMTASKASPSSPSSAKPGALRRALASAALPRPPFPPCARTTRGPAPTRAAITPPSGGVTTGAAGRGGPPWGAAPPAVAAVAPVGAPERLELLAVDRGDAVPAVAGGDVHDHAVDESGHVDERTGSAPPPVSGPSSATSARAEGPCARERGECAVGPSAGPRRERASGGEQRGPLSGLDRGDRDGLASPPRAEGHRTGLQREQRVVAAPADAQARVEVGTALAHDDLAGLHGLTPEALDAEALRVGVAAVAGGRGALLVCHVGVSPS